MNDKMFQLGKSRSVIREIFEYAKIRKSEIGNENVFDFSIGNPSVPSPDCVKSTLNELIQNTDPVLLHGYTSAQGDVTVRKSISEYIEKAYSKGTEPISHPDLIYVTSGAAAALTCSLTALLNKNDEVIILAPFFPEYRVFTERTGAKPIPVLCDEQTMRPRIDRLQKAINKNTVAMIINSPNNPTGVVYPEEDIIAISELLREKSKKFGHPIYLIADEPYRELAYGNIFVPYIPNYYDNTIVCYSLSKSLSLPGERIGYISLSPRAENAENIYYAICGAGRALGFVCATSLFQFLMAKLLGQKSDISIYEKNRDILCSALSEYGYQIIKPDGAFYLFVKAPDEDAKDFCERAKKYELLLVPSDDFGCKGYVRLAYCKTEEEIRKSLPAFKALAESYK